MTAMESILAVERINHILELMPNKFDSHKFIEKLAHEFQSEYVQALDEIGGDTPFHQLHAHIGRVLKGSDRVRKIGQSSTDNIFGNNNACAEWEKTS